MTECLLIFSTVFTLHSIVFTFHCIYIPLYLHSIPFTLQSITLQFPLHLHYIYIHYIVVDYQDRVAAAAPIGIHGATCEIATDYTKRKNVLRMSLPDGAEYLFVVPDPVEMVQWQKKIQHIAGRWRTQFFQVSELFGFCGSK